jgi:sugar/nucleoside kinase (ribokinase family)
VGGQAFRAMTDGVDLVFVTLDEAEILCGSRVPHVVGARLTEPYKEVVLKLGADGALWCSRGNASGVRVPATPPVGPVVDTTGAGDAFAAAWLAARAAGEQAEPALRISTRAAATVVTRVGARP